MSTRYQFTSHEAFSHDSIDALGYDWERVGNPHIAPKRPLQVFFPETTEEVARIVRLMDESPMKGSYAVVITYDENGGFWDHVPPPPGDRWGPGVRIPAILISPWVKKSYVDHTQYDTTAILKFITKRFSLEPLPGVRATMGDLTSSLLDER